jgi:hypothetical protein
MKESNFYSDEFEQLIREKTEQYKMYPSENVWKGVHNSLHTKRKWFISSMAVLVTGILFFSGKELLAPSRSISHKLAAAGLAASDGQNADPARSGQSEDNAHANFVRLHPAVPAAGSGHQPQNHLAITISHPVVSLPDLSELLSHAVQLPEEAPSLIASEPGLLDSWLVRSTADNSSPRRNSEAHNNSAESVRETTPITRETAEVLPSKMTGSDRDADDLFVRGVIESLSAKGRQPAYTYGSISRNPSPRQSSATGRIKDSAAAARASTAEIGERSDLSRVNWLHDYAVYSLPPSPSRGRLFFQLILAPTVNYRNLSGGTPASAKELTGGVSTPRPGDVQNWVDRSPAPGFEFGANLLYRVTRNLTVKGGLQFNYSRYKMIAYTNPPSQPQSQTASASANNSNYWTPYGNRVLLDSVAASQPIQGQNQSIPYNTVQATLYNDYYQLSAPIGFDLRILGNERLQFNIGATIQPSYLLNTDSYILSSDYTSYTKEPSAFRRWNLSGGVEAFLSYQSGPIRWQLGPEFRYQLFSSYLSGGANPISENLKGYGIRLGITKPLP